MPHRFFDPALGDTLKHNKIILFPFHDPTSEGVWHGGAVVEIDATHHIIDCLTKTIKCWPNTTIPILLLIFYVMHNDERRSLWIPKDRLYTDTGSPYLGTRYRALCEAMQAAGVPGELPSIGDELYMRWNGVADFAPRRHPRKLWEMKCIKTGETEGK